MVAPNKLGPWTANVFALGLVLLCCVSGQRWHYPPPKVLIGISDGCVERTDPRLNCNGGRFSLSMGYYIPCRAHVHCYGAREPPNWCQRVQTQNWTKMGCHCDLKIGSCIVEREMANRTTQLEWSYCVPNDEFYCMN